MYVATVALSACGGCENALLSIGEPLIALLSEHAISFSSLLVDRRSISPSDVVLVSGCISNDEERAIASEIAHISRKIIAVGSCAVYGGLFGSRKIIDNSCDDALDAILPRVFEHVEPLDSRVDVELYVPGCPPPPDLIFEALKSALEGHAPPHLNSTVCSDCTRRVARKSAKAFQLHPGPGVPESVCILNSGVLCMGPVTRGGCRAACPQVAAACLGCRGPADAVLSSQLHSVRSDLITYIARTTGSREEKVARQIEPMRQALYMFTGSDPVTKAKVKEMAPDD